MAAFAPIPRARVSTATASNPRLRRRVAPRPEAREQDNGCEKLARPRRGQPRRVPTAKTYRFEARLNEDQKLLIKRAADLEGRTMTDFVLHSAEAAAERTIENRAMLVL